MLATNTTLHGAGVSLHSYRANRVSCALYIPVAERKRFRSAAFPVNQNSAQALAAVFYLGRQQRSIKAKAASKAQIQQRSSPVTGPNGSNGWAWILGGCTLTTGTALPALYLAAHWQQVSLSLLVS
ncbi:TPA: hypothetical protein ACH3X1_014581 [Trebouxia sp. C0004]